MANNTFTPAKGTTYYNASGPNKGVTYSSQTFTPKPGLQYFTAPAKSVLGAGDVANRGAAPTTGASAPINTGGGNSGGGGGNTPGPDYNSINELYDPQISYLNSLVGTVTDSKNSQVADLEKTFGEQSGKLKPEEQSLNDNLNSQKTAFDSATRSAYDEAYRAHSALSQQANARFGRGGSAYGAVSDLANQELQRQVGKVGEQSTQGQLAFGQEFTKVKNYISGKLTDLEAWKRDATSKINDNFTQMMSQINSNRVATEQQKTRDKMGLLQSTIAQSQAIAGADQQFKQQLALFSVQQIANTTGKTFTPAEIKAQIADIMGSLNIGGSQAAAGPALVGKGAGGIFGNSNDPYGQSLG